MKKAIVIIGVVLLFLAGALFFMNNRNRTLSPPGSSELSAGGWSVKVNYSRPSARERLIFGEKEEGALLPYGIYWRLGANEPTIIDVNKDFVFGEMDLSAGKYVIYAIPRKGEMELRLNADLRFWGYSEPDYSQDLATQIVKLTLSEEHTEQFTIEVGQDGKDARLDFSWGSYTWSCPIDIK